MDECKLLPSGSASRSSIASNTRRGRVVQVDPIKFVLKAPGTKHLKP